MTKSYRMSSSTNTISVQGGTYRLSHIYNQQGPAGNWDVRCFSPSTPDRNSGNLFVQRLLTVTSTYDTDGINFGLASISSNGGADLKGSLLVGVDGKFIRDIIAGRNASIGNNLNVAQTISAFNAILGGTASDTLSILQGGVTAASIIANNSLISNTNTILKGSTQIQSSFSVQTTTSSTSPTTGSITTLGGVGVGENINAVGNISGANVNASSLVGGDHGMMTSMSDSSLSSYGAFGVKGGAKIDKSLYVGTNLSVGGTTDGKYRFLVTPTEIDILPDGVNNVFTANTSQVLFGSTLNSVIFQNTENASGYSDGAVRILGGMSVQLDTYLNGKLFLNGSVQGNASVNFTNITQSTAPTNGAVIIAGGLGVNHVTVASAIIAGLSSVLPATNTMSGNLQSKGGLGVVGDAYIGGFLNLGGLATLLSGFIASAPCEIDANFLVTGSTNLKKLHITDGTIPTSYTTPSALLVDGGAIIAGASYVNSSLQVANGLTLDYNNLTPNLTLGSPTSGSSATLAFNGQALSLTAPTTYSIKLISDNGLYFVDGTSVNAVTRFSATTNQVLVNNTVDCTALGTAGLVVKSGASIAKNVIIGQTLQILSSAAQALIVSGGVSIAQALQALSASIQNSLTVGQDLTVTNNTVLNGSLALTGVLNASSSGMFAGGLITGGNISAQSASNAIWNGPTDTNAPAGSLVTYGGGVVKQDFIVGGNETVYGNTVLKQNVNIAGQAHITSTVSSSSPSNQALVVDGGASVNMGLMVTGPIIGYGDTFISGKLVVKGSQIVLNSINSTVHDNILAINVGTRNLPDAGLSYGRNQEANDTQSGFVILDTPAYTFTVASSVSDAIHIQLPNSASSTDNFYTNCWLLITSGTGVKQVRFVDSYVGSTKRIAIRSTAQQSAYDSANPPNQGETNPIFGLDFTTPPDSTSTIALFNTSVGVFLQQQIGTNSEFRLGYTVTDPALSTLNTVLTKLATLRLSTLAADTSVQTNNYNPYNVGDNIKLNNSISVSPTGDLTGVKSLNGTPGAQSISVSIPETANGSTGAVTLPIPNTYGVIDYNITSLDGSGSISAGKIITNQASTSQNLGSPDTPIARLPSVSGEQVGMLWTYGSSPQITLHYPRTSNFTGNPINYKLSYTVY